MQNSVQANLPLKILFSLFFIAISFSVTAQEILSELGYNQALIYASEKYQPKLRAQDTLNLPFIDDFSNAKVYPYPDQKLWADKSVFVNTTYPVNPVSIGVATFDGLNASGMPYNPGGGLDAGPADTLTSQPIHLENLLPSDSLYLSFYYEAQGLGDYPNPGDELMLQFRKDDGSWETVWSKDGSALGTPVASQQFTLVMVPVTDPAYFYNAFQFRFHNIATLSGNNDHWHVDYVKLDKGRTITNTMLQDVAITKLPTVILKNYQQMPWTQFKDNQSTELTDFHVLRLKNNFNQVSNTTHSFSAKENFSGTPLYNSVKRAINFAPGDTSFRDSTFTINANPPVDSASVSIQYVIESEQNVFLGNDTVTRTQNFFNYYAYDDGSAEKGYGLQGTGGRLAVKFSLNHPDTLRAVQIHFAHIDADVSKKLMSVMVWKSLGPDVILSQLDKKPIYVDSLNGFYTYELDAPVIISGEFYIGTLQTFPDMLNIGFDLNTDAHSKLFYNVSGTGGTWLSSGYNGSVMIRPLLGKKLPVTVSAKEISPSFSFTVYPNPAGEELNIKWPNDFKGSYKILDYTGRTMLQSSELKEKLAIETLPAGMYFLQVYEKGSGNMQVQKFIKQ